MEELLAAHVVLVVPVVHVEARLLVASGYRKVEIVEVLLGATYLDVVELRAAVVVVAGRIDYMQQA